jgi:hypothetical protein
MGILIFENALIAECASDCSDLRATAVTVLAWAGAGAEIRIGPILKIHHLPTIAHPATTL